MDEVSTTLIFPVFAADERHFSIAKDCYHKTREQVPVVVVDDGAEWPGMKIFFMEEAQEGHCEYMPLSGHSGLTRSWEEGAVYAFDDRGSDVVIFGNQDAFPAREGDVAALSSFCAKHKGEFFAVGPITNEPGHVDSQAGLKRSEYYRSVPIVNGFTFAVHRENYEKVLEHRETFFIADEDRRYDFSRKEIVHHDGSPVRSLAYVGQEDELFGFAAEKTKKPCAVTRSSFFHHIKLSLHLRACAASLEMK